MHRPPTALVSALAAVALLTTATDAQNAAPCTDMVTMQTGWMNAVRLYCCCRTLFALVPSLRRG